MGSIIRGIKNTWRNPLRTFFTILILSFTMALALVMLLTNQSISSRVQEIKESIGAQISISPAGIMGMEGGGDLLKEEDILQIGTLPNILSIEKSLRAQSSNTSLKSTLRVDRPGGMGRFGGTGVTGTDLVGNLPATGFMSVASGQLVEGRFFLLEDEDKNVAILGKDLAEQNELTVGSTYKLEEIDITIVGIYDTGTRFGNNASYLPLKTVQRIFELEGQLSEVKVKVDSIENVPIVTEEVKNLLGDKADVSSEEERFTPLLSPLSGIGNITRVAMYGAFIAAIIILFFSMTLIVRSRFKEIGVMKAIGASNTHILTQFMSETLSISLIAGIVSFLLTSFIGKSIVTGVTSIAGTGGGRVGGMRSPLMFLGDLSNMNSLNLEVLAYAVLVGIGVGLLGSLIPSWIASQTEPAKVLKYE